MRRHLEMIRLFLKEGNETVRDLRKKYYVSTRPSIVGLRETVGRRVEEKRDSGTPDDSDSVVGGLYEGSRAIHPRVELPIWISHWCLS